MMSIGFWQIAIVVVLVVLLFGRGKISSLMGDVAKGIKSFKKGMSDNTDLTDLTDSTSSDNTSNKDKNSENK
jgi:sec-independent protein translocase protein TatA